MPILVFLYKTEYARELVLFLMNQEEEKKEKIYWHSAFFAALQLELHDYNQNLDYNNEYYLSKEPLRIDVLVIKKHSDINIEKNIGKIFKSHNLFEFKSQRDYLSIWDYIKVNGYAMLYSYFEKVPIEDITISFSVTAYPKKLIKFLIEERNLEVIEFKKGIYYVKGDMFVTQIIENKKLTEKENLFFKNLRKNLKVEDLTKTIQHTHKKEYDKSLIFSYLNCLLEANKDIVKEVIGMSPETLQILDELLTENGLTDKYLEKGRQEGLQEGRQEGEQEAKKETVIKMHKKGYENFIIADLLDMAIELVEEIIK